MTTLEVEGLYAGYGGADILQDVAIEVRPREIVTVIGPNGAGKSTLMKSLFGLTPPRRGSIRFEGEEIAGSRPERLVRQGIVYVPQNENVFPNLTVEENLEMGAFIKPRAEREDFERVYAVFPPLWELRRQPAGLLSGGQQQMVAIGRALMLRPKLLLLDEPTAGLSPAFAKLILEKVREINAAGVPVLMIEQNARAALELSDRAYVLVMGKNRRDGAARDLLEDPQIGAMFLGG